MMLRAILVSVALLLPCSGVAENLVVNPGFEESSVVKGAASGEIGFGIWQLGEGRRVPSRWTLNNAYPGTLTILSSGARSGSSFLRIDGTNSTRPAHMYQAIRKLQPGHWYKVSAWIRKGQASLRFYQYYEKGPIRVPIICTGTAGEEWSELAGYYVPVGDGFKYASLAIVVERGQSVDIDDLRIEALPLAEAPVGAEPITFENQHLRMELSPLATLSALTCKADGKNYAAPSCPAPLLQASVGGRAMPARFLKREGEIVRVQFVDPKVKASLRVEALPRYFRIEVVDAEPADMAWLEIQFPQRVLADQGGAFCANYDDAFASCCFALNTKSQCLLRGLGTGATGLVCRSTASRHGVKGAKFAFLGGPRAELDTLIQHVERDNGLPSPQLDGKWVRESEPIRRSYLFVIGMHEKDTDALIDYAKVGHFQTILILKNAWLKTHGHYEINTRHFPDGRESFKRAVGKIHAAGLKAGVHLFGPSISANDAYVTPVPDDRLLSVECPPLAEAIDAKGKILTVTEQPTTLPPARTRNRAFPGYHLRIGDELVRYADVDVGPPFRFLGCQRGACGTRAAAHPAGAQVRGMLTMWRFFMIDPDSTLLGELTDNFADVVNDCKLDMVYFDASDGSGGAYLDTGYYLDKCHLAHYRKFDHDVLYQTSTGTGRNLGWHFVARSASADGHGDIKWYLDQRLNTILGMRRNCTYADVGWYGLDSGSRVDRLEYICAKCLGADGSISVQCNRSIFDSHPHARQIMEMIGRYERCRLADYYPDPIKAQLREKGKEFKLFEDGQGDWSLWHAAYEPDRVITRLDGKQNVWTIDNDRDEPCRLAIEITRDVRYTAGPDYDSPEAILLEDFEDLGPYALSEDNQFAKYVLGAHRVVTPEGPALQGVTQQLSLSTEDARLGQACGVYTATNSTVEMGWCGRGRRFAKPIDLSRCRGVAMWVHGDGQNEYLMIQFRDVAGRYHHWRRKIGHKGWKLIALPIAPHATIDWTKIEYLIFYYNNIPANTTVTCKIDGVKALPALTTTDRLSGLALTVNGARTDLPGELGKTETLTTDGQGTCTLWPGGMKPGRKTNAPQTAIQLRPGSSELRLSCSLPEGRQPDVNLRLIRLWPVK